MRPKSGQFALGRRPRHLHEGRPVTGGRGPRYRTSSPASCARARSRAWRQLLVRREEAAGVDDEEEGEEEEEECEEVRRRRRGEPRGTSYHSCSESSGLRQKSLGSAHLTFNLLSLESVGGRAQALATSTAADRGRAATGSSGRPRAAGATRDDATSAVRA